MIFGAFGIAELSVLYVCIALLTYRESTGETCLKRPPSQGINSKPAPIKKSCSLSFDFKNCKKGPQEYVIFSLTPSFLLVSPVKQR